MSKVANIDRFNHKEVKRWKRADFIKHFEGRFSNADKIYDAICGKPKKKKEEE